MYRKRTANVQIYGYDYASGRFGYAFSKTMGKTKPYIELEGISMKLLKRLSIYVTSAAYPVPLFDREDNWSAYCEFDEMFPIINSAKEHEKIFKKSVTFVNTIRQNYPEKFVDILK